MSPACACGLTSNAGLVVTGTSSRRLRGNFWVLRQQGRGRTFPQHVFDTAPSVTVLVSPSDTTTRVGSLACMSLAAIIGPSTTKTRRSQRRAASSLSFFPTAPRGLDHSRYCRLCSKHPWAATSAFAARKLRVDRTFPPNHPCHFCRTPETSLTSPYRRRCVRTV